MRILYFSRAYTPHDRRFLAALAASPHEIYYLRLEDDRVRYEIRPPPEGIRELSPLGGGPPLLLPENWLPLAPKLKALLDQLQPDLVHAGPIQSCALLVALAGFHPLLAMSWGSDLLVDADRGPFWSWMTCHALAHADLLVTDCAEVSFKARRLAGLPPDRIVQFPWGVDLAQFPSARHPAGKVAISLRSWEPNYGILHLLEGFRLAHNDDPELRLWLLGDGSLRPEVERFLACHRLNDAVELAGAVSPGDMPEHLASADIYVSCAASDGASISLLEAMATGLPAIVTDRPSNREWVEDGVHGRLVPFGNARAIAHALCEMSALSPDQRREMACRNRAVVEQRADWQRNVRKLLAAYRRLCHDKRRASPIGALEPGFCVNHDTG